MALSERAEIFKASMPPAYASQFTQEDIEQHAQIVESRTGEASLGVVWRSFQDGTTILCVVADDRPGLVSLVSAAFIAHGIDVRGAQIFCRTRPDQKLEAVDFFWVRGSTSGTLPDINRFARCLRTLEAFIRGSSSPSRRTKSERPDAPVVTRIALVPHAAIAESWELSIEAADRPGLLHLIVRTLYEHGLQISSSEIQTEGALACAYERARSLGGPPRPEIDRTACELAVQLGNQDLEAGQVEAALARGRIAVAAGPGDAQAWLFLGFVEDRAGNAQSAIRTLEKASAIDPQSWAGWAAGATLERIRSGKPLETWGLEDDISEHAEP
jgi:glycine cleavage system regulatory protein